jgi:HD-GYP domain-containing protein (c-di-GMP phosphodiesterase class II)
MRPAVIATLAGALVIAALGVVLLLRFVDQERQRDLMNWQVRLGIVADSRKAAIEAWLADQWSDLDGIAQNDSVRLFLSELKTASGDLNAVPDGRSQADYIQNLLVFTAAQGHFTAPLAAPNLPVNIDRTANAGLALFDTSGRLLVATRGTPTGQPWIAALLAGAKKGQRTERDLFLDGAGNPAMAFVEPIFAVQADAVPDQQVGWAMGVKEVGAELYPLLHQPGEAEQTAEAVLVRSSGANVEYLSPLPQYQPLSLTLASITPDLAEAAALRAPGGFGVANDYRNVRVLYVCRALAGSPWVLVYKVDRAEALGATNRRAAQLLAVFGLAIVMLAAIYVAVWRHGASRRAALAAEQFRDLAQRFERQSNLLHLVTDGQPNAIFITNPEGRYTYANRVAAAEAGIDAEDMVGKSLAAVIGPAKAGRYLELNRRAAETHGIVYELTRTANGSATTVMHSQHIPLDSGVLVIEEDLSAVSAEQERRRSTLEHLVRCLIALADRRDPSAAGHSAFVAVVARAVAEEMGLERTLVETAEMAGRLMNLGKILVPASILTRHGPLTPDELDSLHHSMLEATRLLEGVEFDGPVVETLRQCQEHWDGNGKPHRLKGREIIPTARVLAVANAFVGLLSPRAYRARMSLDEASRILVGEIGTKFDPAVVAALVSHLENKGGRAAWAGLLSQPLEPAAMVIDPP